MPNCIMKPIKQAIVVVDSHRRPSRTRNTAGRYVVGAKTAEEAEQLVREAIGFGSVQFLAFDYTEKYDCKYREVKKDMFEDGLVPARHATDPVNRIVLSIDDLKKGVLDETL